VKSIQDLSFDIKFEQSLFRTKSESDLAHIVFDRSKFKPLISSSIPSVVISPTSSPKVVVNSPKASIPGQASIPIQNPPRVMAARFSPLVLPAQLHDLPQNYAQRIKTYGAEEDISAQQHLDRFNDFIDLEEVDYEDVKMRLFAQSFSGEVKKWFKALPTASIPNFGEFETTFLGRWGDKKNPLQLLTQYNNLKILPTETVQEFSTRFLKVYNSIPDQVKPPPGAAQLHYADAFESDFALLLRERRSTTLTDMMNDAIEVEVNLAASGKIKFQVEDEKKKIKDEAQPSTSQSSDAKLDLMVKTMEKLVEKLSLDNKPAP
jgi:hypothetical protein